MAKIIHPAKGEEIYGRLSHQTLRIRAITFALHERLFEKYEEGIMMRKSTVFISAVLTTFAIAILYGVVSAYQSMSVPPKVTPLATNTAAPEPTIEPTATLAMITPEQAAQLAAQVVGKTNLLSAESSTYNGVNAYLITFTNRDVVYVGLDGQILGVQVAPVVMNVSAPAPVKHKNTDNNNDTNSGESHDDHEEHEEQDEHDD